MRYAIAFGRFWYDFLVGDRPALFVGPLLALAVVARTTQSGWTALSGLLLFALILATGGVALAREVAAARVRST